MERLFHSQTSWFKPRRNMLEMSTYFWQFFKKANFCAIFKNIQIIRIPDFKAKKGLTPELMLLQNTEYAQLRMEHFNRQGSVSLRPATGQDIVSTKPPGKNKKNQKETLLISSVASTCCITW